ncbi:hypothetical protein Tco_0457937 [Tanacetum coccineum]
MRYSLLWNTKGEIYLIAFTKLARPDPDTYSREADVSKDISGNLATVTCSLTQSDLVDFVDKYDISLCYDPKLPTPDQTTLDAPEGYIPLYLSLFSIGNLCFPLNDFCLDVFEFFRCHFPLLNPFRVARVTTFAVSCKAYGGEATMPFFRAFLTLGPAGDWLTVGNYIDLMIQNNETRMKQKENKRIKVDIMEFYKM